MVATVDYFNKFLDSSKEIDFIKVKGHPNFLRIIQPFLSAPTILKDNSGKYTFTSFVDSVKSLPEVIALDTGDTMSKAFLLKLLGMFQKHSRSDYYEGTQTKHPSISAAVPLVLYAYRENKRIKYEDWNWNEPVKNAMGAILGKALEDIVQYVHHVPNFDLPTLREEARKSSKGTLLNTKTIYQAKTSDPEFNALPKNLKFMLLQWWIWHPGIRHEAMIMDLNNLDNMPEPLEASHLSEVEIDDIPW